MGGFIQGEYRTQQTLFPGCLDDHVAEDNPARVVDAYIDQLDLRAFESAQPAETGRPGYHPSTLLKIYLYGYLNRIQSMAEGARREALVRLRSADGPRHSRPKQVAFATRAGTRSSKDSRMDHEHGTEEVRIKAVGDEADYDIVAVSVRRTASEALVTLIVRKQEPHGLRA